MWKLEALLQTALKEKQRLVDQREEKKRQEKLTAEAGQPSIRRFSVMPGKLDRASIYSRSRSNSNYGLPSLVRMDSSSNSVNKNVRRKSKSTIKRKDRILEELGEEEAAAAVAERASGEPNPTESKYLYRGRIRVKK